MTDTTNTVSRRVKALVDRFNTHADTYTASRYNETQVRREFLDPLFKALGWDVDNEQDYAEAYKDVIHEDAIKIGRATKAPDYSFRIGGTRKFFVEAKKPSIHIRDDAESAFQLRRYGWSAKLPLSILTNFNEFSVYDCRIKPAKSDRASKARVKYFTVQDLMNEWSDFKAIFSQEAILKGSFDKYADSSSRKRGTAEVDDSFLGEIEEWRDSLARNIALRNNQISHRDLNFAVQKTIDRIIFLRICEDRGVEPYGELKALAERKNVYANLFQKFVRADDRFNSGLFHFKKEINRATEPDDLTPLLNIDDNVLTNILSRLYYPDSPYEFSVLPADILGQVYEQFLGRVIRLTPNHRAKVEEKPEIRKAGGVYYTPTYIVDYIVSHALKPMTDKKTPQEVSGLTANWHPSKSISPLTILDPACGSGSFLLGAYQFLLDWYRDQYVASGTAKHSKGRHPRLFQHASLGWQLTTSERKRILLTHIHGVDIDPQAVETTKLSLLLKVLEGESEQSLDAQLRLLNEKALPDLGNNIKCGNSLIDLDYYKNQQIHIFDIEERLRVNAFDWHREFESIFRNGGFDAVIGNPPYRREKDFKYLLDDISRTNFGRLYRSARMDLWYYFVHRGLELLRTNGTLSFITNAYWTSGTGASKLIGTLQDDCHVEEFFSLGKLNVFRGVSGQHMIMRVRNKPSKASTSIKAVADQTDLDPAAVVRDNSHIVQFTKTRSQLFHDGKVDLQPPRDDLLKCFERGAPLECFGRVRQGIAENPASINRKTNDLYGDQWEVGEGVFALKADELKRLTLPTKERALLRPYHDLQDVGRYRIGKPSLNLIYSTKQTCPRISKFPRIQQHLERFKPIMDRRRETQSGSNSWWHLHWPREEAIWKSPKIICVQMSTRPAFVPSWSPTYVPFSINVFVPDEDCDEDLRYVTGILNSRLLWLWFSHNAKRRGVGLEINGNVLRRAPVVPLNSKKNSDKQNHDRLVSAVQRMLDLQKSLSTSKTNHERNVVQREIVAVDREIDALVYRIYRLSDDQIRMVEQATS